MSESPQKRQLGARVSLELYRRIRVLAAEQDRSISALVEEALEDVLAKYAVRRRQHG